jgi:hypothetical protein
VSHIQASATHPTIRQIARLCRFHDPRQVRRILKRLEKAGLLTWQHHLAVYRSNRLQYVPIVLHWELLRKPEPTPSSTREPTLAKSLGIKCFEKKQTEKIETLTRPVSALAPEQPTSPAPYPDTWDKVTGFEIPDKDLESIAGVIKAKGMSVDSLQRDLLAWMVYTVWMRATRPERSWKAYYGAAVYKMLNSDKAYHGALHNWEERARLYAKWFQDTRKAQMTDDDIRTANLLSPLTGSYPAEMAAVLHAIVHHDGLHLDERLAQALSGVRLDFDAEFGLVSFSVQGHST